MFFFSFEYGMETTSWCAELAFRTRVSMSAIGSVMVIVGSPPFLTGVSTVAICPATAGPSCGRPTVSEVCWS